jgi:hypothetical protein
MSSLLLKYNSSVEDKLRNFEKYVKRQALTRFIARYELFKKIINIKGSIVECGVHHGGGLMAWAKLSAGLEPMALHRKIIGFDTFEGFPSIDNKDVGIAANESLKEGGFGTGYNSYDELLESIKEFDDSRYLNQYPKVELVKGDSNVTIPEYIKNNQHLIVALLFMDFDLYAPTKTALEYFLNRIPRGGILAFDEINNSFWPGETIALLEQVGSLNNLNIQKFYFDPSIAYIVL